MKSEAADVDGYIASAPEERRAVLRAVRAVYRKELKDCEECIDYGMPVYKLDGVMMGAFASQKGYLAVYGMGNVMAAYKAELKGASLGKGCVRFKDVAKVDVGVVERMLRDAVALKRKG
jgi:uncharacterized protein YdhG (YjbR/CyaY superfamily)